MIKINNREEYFASIYNKIQNGYLLEKKDIDFLNSLDSKINESNYYDYFYTNKVALFSLISRIYGCSDSQIATSIDDYLLNHKRYKVLVSNEPLLCYEDYYYELPEILLGSLTIKNTSSLSKDMPRIVSDTLVLSDVKTFNQSFLPSFIGEKLIIKGKTKVDNFICPNNFEGHIEFNDIEECNIFDFSKSNPKSIQTFNLKRANRIRYPKKFNNGIYYNYLENINELYLPKYVSGSVSLPLLKDASGVTFPEEIVGYLDISSVKEPTSQILLPKRVSNLYMKDLTTLTNISMPEEIYGYLFLFNLENSEGLLLPDGYDLSKLFCNEEIKSTILSDTEKYYKKQGKKLIK